MTTALLIAITFDPTTGSLRVFDRNDEDSQKNNPIFIFSQEDTRKTFDHAFGVVNLITIDIILVYSLVE